MGAKQKDYVPTTAEEIANVVTAAFGLILFTPGIIAMWTKSVNSEMILSTALYGSSLIILFGTSALFHWYCYILKCELYPPTKKQLRLRRIFQLLDRSAIYFVISSSYAPWFLLTVFPENSWISSIRHIYFIAALGTVFEFTLAIEYPITSLIFYIALGAITPLSIFLQVSAPGFIQVIVASLTYVLGVAFFVSDEKIPFAHAIWHMFVLAGTVIHFSNVYLCFYQK